MKSNPFLTFPLFLLIGLNNVEARLGETLEQIQARFKTTFVTNSIAKRPELVEVSTAKVAGFDVISFIFFKDGAKGGRCIHVGYWKFYEKMTDVEFTPKDAILLVNKNFPDPSTNMKIDDSEGISGETATESKWIIRWNGANGERARAGVDLTDSYKVCYSVTCSSAEYTAFLRSKEAQEEKIKEQTRQKNLDSL